MLKFSNITVLSAIALTSASVTLFGLQGCTEMQKFQKTSEIMGKASAVPFDPIRWKSDKKIRDQMWGGLSLVLKGMTIAKAKEQLGEPDSSSGDATSSEGMILTYDMQNAEGKAQMYLNVYVINGTVDRIETSLAK